MMNFPVTSRLPAKAILAAVLVVLFSTAARAEQPRVVVTIKPAHSLVAAVMEGVAEPELLIAGAGSPHGQALKPSQARSLQEAGAVVRVSRTLETFLNRPLANLSGEARVITLDETPGLLLHEVREGGLWEGHEHEHEHEASAEHTDHPTHDHEEQAEEGQHDDGGRESGAEAHDAHDAHEEHAHGAHNPHLWLDPDNARKLAGHIATGLSQVWPQHESAFEANAARLRERLAALDAELAERLAPLRDKPYIVFHDAYRYFEERYGLRPAGSVTVAPERVPGARRLSEIRARIREAGAQCVFAEPQFEPRLVETLIKGTRARSGVLDPLGAALEPGSALYFTLMRNLARGLADCLTPS